MHSFHFLLRRFQIRELADRKVNIGKDQQYEATRGALTIDRPAVGRPARAVILGIPIVRCHAARFAGGHIENEQILVEVRLHVLDEELAIVRRPGQRRVIATRSALNESYFLVARFLHVDVKPALLLAIGAEGDLLAVMTPTAERVNRFGMSGEIGARPAFTDAMVAAAGDAAQVIKLRALVAAGVHAVDDFMTDGTVV